MRHLLPLLLALLAAVAASPAPAAPAEDGYTLEDAYPGRRFTLATGVYAAPRDARHLYVLERAGRVLRFARDGSGPPEVVLDLRAVVDSRAPEAGLLGLAFDPDWPRMPRVWLSYTAPGRDGAALETRLVRMESGDGGRHFDPASAQLVLRLDQPWANHNGGRIAFGPDGYLYFGLGDGGAGGDPQGNAQRLDTWLGKLLRLDVRGTAPYTVPPDNPFVGQAGARPEIWALGLRNPWGWSFDRRTGALWLGDVGQDRWEEIDRIERGGNYGWNHREGRHCFKPRFACRRRGLIDPLAEYGHTGGRCSVTGGYVYRGPRLPALRGWYVYGDFCSGELWALDAARPGEPRRLADTDVAIAAFGEDVDGELLVVEYAGRGRLLRLAPAARAGEP